jgi:hypothetical protein
MAFRVDEAEDGIRERTRPETSDVITAEDAFPEGSQTDEIDTEADADEPAGLMTVLPGPVVAAATFVPTFLVVFFTLSSLMGPAGPPVNAGASAALKSDPGGQPTPTLSEALRDPFIAPSLPDSIRPPEPSEAPRRPAAEDAPAPTVESARPSLPPAQPRAPAPAPEPRVRRSPEPPRPPQAAVLTAPDRTPSAAPAVETRKSGRDWTPAAAFADREAANRLANSIQQQGYPVEIRQEQSATRPWVVWIGAQPHGADRRR